MSFIAKLAEYQYQDNDIRYAISGCKIDLLQKILEQGFDPIRNISRYNDLTITPLIFTLGHALLSETWHPQALPLEDKLQTKKIVQILLTYGAPNKFDKLQANDLLLQWERRHEKKYEEVDKMIKDMEELLDMINKTIKAINDGGTFLAFAYYTDKGSFFAPFPEDIVHIIASTLKELPLKHKFFENNYK